MTGKQLIIAILFLAVLIVVQAHAQPSQLISSYVCEDGSCVWAWVQLREGVRMVAEDGGYFLEASGDPEAIAALSSQLQALTVTVNLLRTRVEELENAGGTPALPANVAITVINPPVTAAARAAADAAAPAPAIASCTLPDQPPMQAVPVGFGWSGLPDSPRFGARCGGRPDCAPGAVYYGETFGSSQEAPREAASVSVCVDTLTVDHAAEIRFYAGPVGNPVGFGF